MSKYNIHKNKFIPEQQMSHFHVAPSNQAKAHFNYKKNEPLNIDMIKKNLLYDALSYNLREEEIKSNNKRKIKQDEVETFTKINRRVSTELEHEKEVQKERKLKMRKLLADEYEKQIEEKRKLHIQEIKTNKSYAQIEEENQNRLDERRAREMARMYGRQRFNSSYNPESIQTISHQPSQSYEVDDRAHTQQIQQAQPVSYKDYLEEEIQRRRLQKQKQKSLQRQRQIEFISKTENQREKEAVDYQNSVQRQRENFKKGLDDQIAYKKNIYHYP